MTSLVSQVDTTILGYQVPTCPAWSVRDVVSHVTAVAEDVLEGRLTGPPSDEQTRAQVARLRDLTMRDVLTRWAEVAPPFEEMINSFRVWPAVIDLVTHEQDIRGAIDAPGARDADVVLLGVDRLLRSLEPPVPLRVEVEAGEYQVGPEGDCQIVLMTERFDAFRWRMGRRSRAQLANLEWTGDPSPILDYMAVFGPSPVDIDE